MTKDIVFFGGLGDMVTSPILDLLPTIQVAIGRGVRYHQFHWRQIWEGIDYSQFKDSERIVTAGHSLGGFASLKFASVLDSKFTNRVIPIYSKLFEPVPGDPDNQWEQFGANPLLISPNVIECKCYVKIPNVFPFSKPLAFPDGQRFANYYIWAGHNDIVSKCKDEFQSSINQLLM